MIVDAVVLEPWGAHPSYAQGYYDRDNDFYVAWERISRDPGELRRYLDEFVHGVPDRAAYLEKHPTLETLLQAKQRRSSGENNGFCHGPPHHARRTEGNSRCACAMG